MSNKKTKAVDVKQWYKDKLKPLYEKNIRVAREVFGLDVIGYAYVANDDGSPHIYEANEFDWVEAHLLTPVYVDTTRERKSPRRKVMGRDVDAMYPVPDYFGCIEDAWLIIRKFAEKRWDMRLICEDGEEWRCALGGSWCCEATAKTPEAAICLAALGCVNQT